MATANLKRKHRLLKFESYKAANSKEVQKGYGFIKCVLA